MAGLAAEARGDKPAVMEPVLGLVGGQPFFAEGHHFVRHHARGLGLGEGGADTAVLDEVAHQVGEQRGAMLSGTAQFGFAYAMAHGACVFLLVSAPGLVEQRGGRVDRRGFFVVVEQDARGTAGTIGLVGERGGIEHVLIKGHAEAQAELDELVLDFVE